MIDFTVIYLSVVVALSCFLAVIWTNNGVQNVVVRLLFVFQILGGIFLLLLKAGYIIPGAS